MSVILQINYTPATQQLQNSTPEVRLASAANINQLDGFRWKIWLTSSEPLRRGGIYFFDSVEQARAWGEKAKVRLESAGGTQVDVRYFNVDLPPSEVNHAPL